MRAAEDGAVVGIAPEIRTNGRRGLFERRCHPDRHNWSTPPLTLRDRGSGRQDPPEFSFGILPISPKWSRAAAILGRRRRCRCLFASFPSTCRHTLTRYGRTLGKRLRPRCRSDAPQRQGGDRGAVHFCAVRFVHTETEVQMLVLGVIQLMLAQGGASTDPPDRPGSCEVPKHVALV